MSSPDGAFVRGVVGPVSAGQVWQPPRHAFPARSQYGADSAWDVSHVPVGRVGQRVGLAENWAEKPIVYNGLQESPIPTPGAAERRSSCSIGPTRVMEVAGLVAVSAT